MRHGRSSRTHQKQDSRRRAWCGIARPILRHRHKSRLFSIFDSSFYTSCAVVASPSTEAHTFSDFLLRRSTRSLFSQRRPKFVLLKITHISARLWIKNTRWPGCVGLVSRIHTRAPTERKCFGKVRVQSVSHSVSLSRNRHRVFASARIVEYIKLHNIHKHTHTHTYAKSAHSDRIADAHSMWMRISIRVSWYYL